MIKIALDAGHYLYTPGRRCLKKYDPKETREWQLNSRICEKIEKKLEKYEGYSLLRTDDRTGQSNISLSDRVKKANSFKADILISIHHNGGINGGSGGGIVAYSYPDSVDGKTWRNEVYDELIKLTGLRGNRSNPKAEANYYIIRYIDAPAILLELGFMDSSTDISIIISDAFANKCAEAIVSVIVKKFNLKARVTAQEALLEDNIMRYNKITDMPKYAQKTILKLVNNGLLKGTEENVESYDLSEDMIRMLVILDRTGMFDK